MTSSRRISTRTEARRLIRALALTLAATFGIVACFTGSALAVTGAISTTTNPAVDNGGAGEPVLCLNGGAKVNEVPAVNCNIYTAKSYVWLSGLPVQASLGAGTYFFAVLAPGGQANPNEGGADNLSDEFAAPYASGAKNADGSEIPSGDTYLNRTFTVDGAGNISYTGDTAGGETPHGFADNEIRLMPYDDTTNPGGVYILAVCKVPSTPVPSSGEGAPGVNPSSCKYDAFKVRGAEQKVNEPASGLSITKDAAGAFDESFKWGIKKNVDKTLVEQIGGTATFTYTIEVTHDAGTVSGVKVTGTISVFDPNEDEHGATVPVEISGVSDELSNGTVCAVTNGGPQSLTAFETDFAYECELSELQSGLNNTATVSWPEQTLSNGKPLSAGSESFTFFGIEFARTSIDNCVTVTDTFKGALGEICIPAASPTKFEYSREVTVPQSNCVHPQNIAEFVTNTTSANGSDSQEVEVCGPAKTGALTMGFWQNKNGQSIISNGASTSGVCNSGTWLRQYAPFQDLNSTASCKRVAEYVYNVIKAAVCTSTSKTCNSMLKAQMLATALDVYFSDPALGGNKIGAPAPIGGVKVDLTKVCRMIDGSGGTATCGGTFENVSSAFGGATSMTVNEMLAYAASQSNAGGSIWYGQVKATQVLAKDAFDAVNNQVIFSP